MIKKPQNYENLKNSFESLNAGGHKCVIMEAKEDKDPNGRDILRISFDTANDDTQPKYFSNLYIKDTRPDKKWSYSGQKTFWQDSEWFESNLSKMTGAIEKSNPDVEIWSNGVLDLAKLKGLKVGIVSDISHSRVCGSLVPALKTMGARVTLIGPATLMPPAPM